LLLYYITDRKQLVGDESNRRSRLFEKIAEASRAGVDYIQLREKDVSGRELENLADEAARVVRANSTTTKLLINARTDIAIASGANGVHLPSNDISAQDVRDIWARSGTGKPVISISCHSIADVEGAAADGTDLALFAPVFEKKGVAETRPTGLDALRKACEQKIPVLALGGVTLQNAKSCIEAGAAGMAAIRLFQENDVAEVVRQLRRFK